MQGDAEVGRGLWLSVAVLVLAAPAAVGGALVPDLAPVPLPAPSDEDAGPATSDVETPPREPLAVRATIEPTTEPRTVVATVAWEADDSFVGGVLRLEPHGGLSPVSGVPEPVSLGPAERMGERVLALRAEGDGPFALHATLDGTFVAMSYRKTSVAAFHYDAGGAYVPGVPGAGDAAGVDVFGGVLPGPAAPASGGGPTPQATCTTTFTVHYTTSSGTSIPSGKRGLPVRGLEVNIRNSANTILQTRYTNANGDASFTITADPCNSFNILRQMIYKDGSTEKLRGTNLASTLLTGTTTQFTVANGGTVYWSVSEGHTGSAYMLGQFVESYEETKADGYTMTPVQYRWTQNQARSSGCTTCYEGGNPGTIWMNGTDQDEYSDWETYHEYGHHVQYNLAGSLPGSSYGNHNCTDCHRWDSVHGTLGSAFKEAWANFYVGLIRDTASIGIGDLEDPNVGRTDNVNLDNWGPFREGAIAGALWDAKKGSGVTRADFYQTLDQNPADVHRFFQQWGLLSNPASSTFQAAMEGLHMAASGDGDSYVDAGNTHAAATGVTVGNNDGSITYETHETTVDRNDYYSFSASSGQQIQVTMAPQSGKDLDLYLYNPSGTLKGQSTNGGGASESITFTADSTGSWRFAVVSYTSAEAQGRYTYTLSVGTPNDLGSVTITSVPSTVSPGAGFSVCWDVTGSGTISHTGVHHGTSSGSYPSHTTAQSGTAPANFCASLTAPSSGSVYLRAHAQGPNDDLTSSEARVEVVVAQNDCGSGGDAGGSHSSAYGVGTPPRSCGGTITPTDIEDWYKFPITIGETITISMTPASGQDFDLCLYNPSGTQVGTCSTAGSGSTDTVSATATVGGDWRAKIYYYGGGGGAYSFSVSACVLNVVVCVG
ncbi:MAG: pre-peptidase C-terminal domain-containing protein [Methanobacteriota archaeon]